MREIKFRGLRTDGKGWVYGEYMGGDIHIKPSNEYEWWGYEVLPESVGQFTGRKCAMSLQDVYEGDLFKDQNGKIWNIEYDDLSLSFIACAIKRKHTCRYLHAFEIIEIIGNIHQKHELLKP